jgi:ATP synthase protein I
MPIFLVLFTLLGFAAGVKTMLRSAKEMQDNAMQGVDPKANAALAADDEEED